MAQGAGNEGRGGCFWAAIFLMTVVGVVIALLVLFPNSPELKGDPSRLIYLLVLLGVVAVGAGGMFSESPSRTFRHIGMWAALAAGIALAYAFRGELGFARDRVVGNALPAKGVAAPDKRSVTLYAQGGHFFAEAEVEGKKVMFMVDTGASDVVLSAGDALRIGITPAKREFTKVYNTANGTMRGAPVVLDSVAIGPIDVRYVDASVAESDLQISLLGMSFLNRLSGYQVSGDGLTLKQ